MHLSKESKKKMNRQKHQIDTKIYIFFICFFGGIFGQFRRRKKKSREIERVFESGIWRKSLAKNAQ